jgi:hypothetical protein
MKRLKWFGSGLCLLAVVCGMALALSRAAALAQGSGQDPPQASPAPLSPAVQEYAALFVERRDALNPFFPAALVNILVPYLRTARSGLDTVAPPPGLEAVHATLGNALDDCARSAQIVTIGLENLSDGETRTALEALNRCAQQVADATELMLQHGAPADTSEQAP